MTTLLAVVTRAAVSMGADAREPVHRIRTVLLHPASGTLSVDEHLRVRLVAHRRHSAFGDVLIGHGAGAEQAVRLARSCPGALVVAVHDGPRCWIRLGRGGRVIGLRADGPGRPEELWDILASLAHSCLVAGLPAPGAGRTAARPARVQAPGPSCRNRWSRSRTASASSDCDRPTEE